MRLLYMAVLCAARFISRCAADLNISDWVVPPKSDPYYPSMDASVGDTITFTWSEGITDVHIHPTGTCDEEGAILVSYRSPASYTFTEEDAGKELFFANNVGRRCEDGQNLKVLVANAAAQVSAIKSANDSAAPNQSVRTMIRIVIAVGLVTTTPLLMIL